MACDSVRAHTIYFNTGQSNVCENGDVAVCPSRAPNEMNACAQPYPNYREWKEVWGGLGVAVQAEMGEKSDVQR